MSRKKCAALVLAAGQGTRMKSEKPKVLHAICGVSLVEHIVSTLSAVKMNKIVVVVGYKQELVRSSLKDSKADFVIQKEQLGTAHAVKCARGSLRDFSGDVLVIAGDVPLIQKSTLRSFVGFHRKNRSKATVLTTTVNAPKAYGRIVRDGQGHVIRIVEELDASAEEKAIKEINSGIYLFDAKLLFKEVVRIKRNRKKREFYLTDIVEALIEKNITVNAYRIADADQVRGINSRKDLGDLNRIMNKTTIRLLQESGVTILSEESTFIEQRVKIGRDTVIYPFTFIARDVTIGRNCKLGPFCKIRSKTRIKNDTTIGSFVELNRSSIDNGVTIKHLAYIGDAWIGKNVNIGAGTITANFDGKKKHKTVIKDRALIGANTVLVAPVTVGRSAKTGAGSVVCAGRNIPDNKIAVGVPAKVIK
ncbi:MAG: bifunctional N-acetylglucosamine-1-phosphate uridyltransferase/glucosamine-1-phosphate acetyltransferase [Candidatus Omnitrophica bacterium]|nr:bifunctional N-acetylglucosamine-1-phosphate uridyltransferase/glucosamine-1-phosphate acetyltransferase [Candidatus Omnitrophota bacterium]